MHDPSHALQKQIVARIKAQVLLVAARVYDHTQQTVQFPYIQIGAMQSVPADAGCIDGATCYATLHIWSTAVGGVECRKISDHVTAAFEGWTPDLEADGFACIECRCTSVQTMRDPDNETTHGVVTIEAQTERL